eukprot:3919159-Alexandrium_andersonii.AAC.1
MGLAASRGCLGALAGPRPAPATRADPRGRGPVMVLPAHHSSGPIGGPETAAGWRVAPLTHACAACFCRACATCTRVGVLGVRPMGLVVVARLGLGVW